MTSLLKKALFAVITTTAIMSCKKEQIDKIYCEESMLCQLLVYPNPTDGVATVSFFSNLNDSASLSTLSIFGVEVQQQLLAVTHGSNEFSLDLSDQENGVYIVLVTFNDELDNVVIKIVEQ